MYTYAIGSEKLCEMRLKEIEKEDSENHSEEEAERGTRKKVMVRMRERPIVETRRS